MNTVKPLYKFICIYPWFFLFYFFAVLASNGHLFGAKKDLTITPFFIGLGLGATLIFPTWVFVSLKQALGDGNNKTFWIYFTLFLVPTIVLFTLLKLDPYNFWGDIVD